MMKPLLEIGYGNFVFPEQVAILLSPDSQPTTRLVQEAKEQNKVFDICKGRKVKAVILLKSGEIILSAITAKTIKNRYMDYIDKVNKNSQNNHYIEPFLEIGFDNYVFPENVGAIFNPESQPIKRLIKDAKLNNRYLDIKRGRKTRAVLVLNSGQVVVSAIDVKTIKSRYLKYINKVNCNEKESINGREEQ